MSQPAESGKLTHNERKADNLGLIGLGLILVGTLEFVTSLPSPEQSWWLAGLGLGTGALGLVLAGASEISKAKIKKHPH